MKMKTKKNKGVIVAVAASDSNNTKKYYIRRVPAGLVCPCFSFRYAHGPIGSRTKVCKHIERMSL